MKNDVPRPAGAGQILVDNLQMRFRQRGSGREIVAIESLTFTVEPGEVVAIVGRTGCGKSTFFNILLGLERPSGGSATVDGERPYENFQSFKGVIGAVFQEDRLLPWRSALDNVTVGLEILGWDRKRQVELAQSWLRRMGLAGFETAYPHELSGGMRQRVALARIFAFGPKILLADEAFGHLDEVTAAQLRREFLELSRATKSTTILVTHQLDEAVSVSDRTLVFGRPARLLADVPCRGLSDLQKLAVRQRLQTLIDTGQDAEVRGMVPEGGRSR